MIHYEIILDLLFCVLFIHFFNAELILKIQVDFNIIESNRQMDLMRR